MFGEPFAASITDIDEAVDLADAEALAGMLRRVGDLLVEYDRIAEIDINPILATSNGTTVLDAVVVLEG